MVQTRFKQTKTNSGGSDSHLNKSNIGKLHFYKMVCVCVLGGVGGGAERHCRRRRKHASTYSPVAFRLVHTGIEPPFLLKIYYAITACMTQGFTSRKYRLKEK